MSRCGTTDGRAWLPAFCLIIAVCHAVAAAEQRPGGGPGILRRPLESPLADLEHDAFVRNGFRRWRGRFDGLSIRRRRRVVMMLF